MRGKLAAAGRFRATLANAGLTDSSPGSRGQDRATSRIRRHRLLPLETPGGEAKQEAGSDRDERCRPDVEAEAGVSDEIDDAGEHGRTHEPLAADEVLRCDSGRD